MKKKLLLITRHFPFNEGERSFLWTEFQRLTEEFEVSVLSTEAKDVRLIHPFPSEIPLRRFSLKKPVRQEPKALLWLLTVPFRPFIVREVLRAVRGCPVKTALQRIRQIVKYCLGAERCMPFLRRIVAEDKIDLIYTYWCTEMTLAAVLLKRHISRLKVVTRLNGYELYLERSPVGWQPFRQRISQGCDLLIFACEAGRKYFLETWGERWKSKSFVNYIGSPGFSNPSQSNQGGKTDLTLVSCSSIIPLKRIHLIIDALRLLPEDVLICWHHFGGDGEDVKALTEYTENKFDSMPNIHWKFWGFVPNHELDALYQTIRPDVFITTSSTEGGTPASMLEASSVGIPAIATAVGGIPEFVQDEETGFLLSANPSAEEVADAIRRFYGLSVSEKDAIAKSARALWAEKFDAAKNAEVFAQRLQQLLLS